MYFLLIIILAQQMRWLNGKTVDFHLGVQRSITTNGTSCGQRWNVDRIFLTYITYLSAY